MTRRTAGDVRRHRNRLSRQRCRSRKVAYRDRVAAMLAAATHHTSTSKGAEVAYRCPDCHAWHLTTRKAR